MNKLILSIFNAEDARQMRIAEVVDNSMTLQKAFGLSDSDVENLLRIGKPINCGRYDVVVSNRAFKPWMTVMEIVPAGTDAFNCGKCPWPITDGGTATINIAPPNVLQTVLNYIKSNA